ncbi:MAG: 3-deoxy-8-phosphooctulonate synthase [Candidatus Cloacimonetes bacterium]|nr:3-deoxy-8-phosphooctulonate synthase [Candidatus Cloacimonadota bacterium]
MISYENLVNCRRFFLIAGPCLAENADLVYHTATFLQEESAKRDLIFIFKASFKKANRSSVDSATGPGLEKGLSYLRNVRERLGVPVLTDVHEVTEIEAVADVADVIQIPAFLSRQTDLIIQAAATGKIINIKKGQFMAPEDMAMAAGKVRFTGNEKLLLTERGTFFGYHNLVVDFRNFSIMSDFGYPVVYDVTHSLQKPSEGKTTGGTPEFAVAMARAALATGKVKGLFLEAHPHPRQALSDALSQIALDRVPDLLDACLRIMDSSK